jgi:hypothetical protein
MMAKTKTNNGVSNLALRDCISALRHQILFPLETLSYLLIEASFHSDQPTLEGIGLLLDALVTKAKVILREYLNEPAED